MTMSPSPVRRRSTVCNDLLKGVYAVHAVNRTGSGSFDFNRQRVQESSSDEGECRQMLKLVNHAFAAAANYNQYVGVNGDGDDGDVGIQLNQM